MNKTGIMVAAIGLMLGPSLASAQDAGRATSWTGAYVGGAVGYAYGGDDRVAFDGDPALGIFRNKGPLARVHVGYSYEPVTDTVVGGQIGFAVGDVDDAFDAEGDRFAIENDHVLSARAMVGRVLPHETLLYATAGLAQGRFTMSARNNPGPDGAEARFTSTGYTLGFGVERQLGTGTSVFGEYEYADFGKTSVTLGESTTQATPKWSSVSIGVNYRF